MNALKKLLCAVLILAVLAAVALSVHADFGDFAGDADFGGDDFDFDDDFGDYDGYDSDRHYSGDNSEFTIFDFLLLIGIIVLFIFLKIKSAKKPSVRNAGAQKTNISSLTPMANYSALDPGFNERAFCEKLSNLYVQMQNGWMAKNIDDLRPYFTDAYFNQMLNQLEGLKRQGVTNRVERIAVLGVRTLGYMQAGNEDHIIVELRTRITDYTVRDSDGSVVGGNPNKQLLMVYEWDVCRAAGQITREENGIHTVTCPHCGAAVDINASAQCPYCDSVITETANDWAICRISAISRTTM